MPLRKEVVESNKPCEARIQLIKYHPELLTDVERLNMEAGVRVLATLVAAPRNNDPPSVKLARSLAKHARSSDRETP